MQSIRIVMVAALVALGCGKQLNADYCASHPADGDCADAGLASFDAPKGCSADTDCSGMTPVCDTTTGQCVQCTTADNKCPSAKPVCGLDDACYGCLTDADCSGGVCKLDGTCTAADSVLYVGPNAPAGALCTPSNKCDIKAAVTKIDATHMVIKVDAGDYTGPVQIPALTVQILGPSTGTATINGGPNGPIFSLVGGNVGISELTINGSKDSDGVQCSNNAMVTLHHVTISNNNKAGISANGCNMLHVDRSTLFGNVARAMDLTATSLAIVNNVMYGNGVDMLNDGNVHIANGGGYVKYNTVALNKASNKGQDVGGVFCTAGTTVTVSSNIIVQNGKNQTNTGCTFTNNYTSGDAATVHFMGPADFHLTAATPAPTIRDNRNTGTDCKNGSGNMFIDDIDAKTRPVAGFCDLGADEFGN